MKLNIKFTKITLLLLALVINNYSQSVTKVLISGIGGQHDEDVKKSFELGYKSYDGTEFKGTLTNYVDYGITNTFEFAETNDYQLVVRSTTGLEYAISQAAEYEDIQLVMPAGSNSNIYIYSGDIEDCPVIITGAGDECNETGYKVEFYGPDPITIEPDYSSFSNGYIAGQLAFIANEMGVSIQAARLVARESLPSGRGPDICDGYGVINIQTSLDNVLPVELVSFAAELSYKKVKISWHTETEVNNFGFEIQRTVLNDYVADREFYWESIGFVSGHGNSNIAHDYLYFDEHPVKGALFYRLKQFDTDGSYEYSDRVKVVYSSKKYAVVLKQNYPNPFNPVTLISYTVPDASTRSYTVIKVFDELGQEVSKLFEGYRHPGEYSVEFDASSLPSGTYFYQLVCGNYMEVKKMLLVK